MTAKVTAELAAILRDTFREKVSYFREVLSDDSKPFFDVVVITSADEEQTKTYETNIANMLADGRIPKQTSYIVFPDPPGRRVGCGGATLYVLAELEKRFGKSFDRKSVLLIHAGGYSKRLPNHSHCGKVFSMLPIPAVGESKSAMTMLELKLATFSHVQSQIPSGKGGIFVTCSDDIIFYDSSTCDFSQEGFTALGHPSPVTIGKDHGVFVLDSEDVNKSGAGISKCKKFIHKYPIEKQKSEGAVIGKDLDGEDEVFTDSCYFFSSSVSVALLELFRTLGNKIEAEVDAYGDFMQCLGPLRSTDFFENFGNTAKQDDDEECRAILNVRRSLYKTLEKFDLHCLRLPGSRFYHVGTMREALYHFCVDEGLLTALDSKLPENGVCVIESVVASTSLEGPTIIEFSRIPKCVTVGPRSIISGVAVPEGTGKLPDGIFLQTLPIRQSDGELTFVTHILPTDADLKKSYSKIPLFGFETDQSGSLWSTPLFPTCSTAAESLSSALEIYKSLSSGTTPSVWSSKETLTSLADAVMRKALDVQKEMRKKLLADL